MSTVIAELATRSGVRLEHDPSRVVTLLFVPGQEAFDHHESRASAVVERVLALEEPEVERALEDVVARFASRHRDLLGTFERHAEELSDRVGTDRELSAARRSLLGATFTSEYAIEGAALCNPSVVAHPDQVGCAPGSLRLLVSVRAIGEGHRSSIGFRTGVVDAAGAVRIDTPPVYATRGRLRAAPLDAEVFRSELHRLRSGGETADFVLDALGERFGAAELDVQLERLHRRLATRRQGAAVIAAFRRIAERTYGVEFDPATLLDERVLFPATPAESGGIEDARFVRFTDDDGTATYYATYTAYDGNEIGQQLLETRDFLGFRSSPIVGAAASNKGLALFPRRIGGRFAALSRADRETNAVAFSDSLSRWERSVPCQVPTRSWEVLQLGNCGSPIETEAGWLVLTHGVGPMRTYRIGAMLLDLDDPTRVIGQLREPLLSPGADERDGYVPNVVYSCGALVHRDTLVMPYGISDCAVGVATIDLPALLDALVASR